MCHIVFKKYHEITWSAVYLFSIFHGDVITPNLGSYRANLRSRDNEAVHTTLASCQTEDVYFMQVISFFIVGREDAKHLLINILISVLTGTLKTFNKIDTINILSANYVKQIISRLTVASWHFLAGNSTKSYSSFPEYHDFRLHSKQTILDGVAILLLRNPGCSF